MEYSTIGNTTVPVMGIGTWLMGGRLKRDEKHDKECIAALQKAVSLGMTHIDTAELYGDGHAEEIVGVAIKKFSRKKLFITSKVRSQHLHYEDVITACERSLKRLQTEYLDLYLIHAPNPDIPITETMKAMDVLLSKGRIKYIGVSNFPVDELKEAQKFTKNTIVANQIEYSLLARDAGRFTDNMESEIIPYCQQHGISVISWRTLAYGLLAKPGFPVLDAMARKYKKTQAQVALNWVIAKDILVIPKATKPEHIEENLGALGWRLTEEDANLLEVDFEKWKHKYYKELLEK